MRIVLFIGRLKIGGAERQMSLLANGLAGRGHSVALVSIFPGGQYWDSLSESALVQPVALFGTRPKNRLMRIFSLLAVPLRLRRTCRGIDVVYSMLYYSMLTSWFATRGMPDVKLVWGVRGSRVISGGNTRVVAWLCGLFGSRVPLVICNSDEGKKFAKRKGLAGRRTTVVHNGIDTNYFKFDACGRDKVRAEWGFSSEFLVIGMIARLTEEKRHDIFLEAAAAISLKRPNFRFVCVGSGSASYTAKLREMARKLNLDDRILWAGSRTDMTAVYSALDLCCLTSDHEGFPNVLAEAMACGIRCVATDAGDAAKIIGSEGRVVPRRNVGELHDAILALADLGPRPPDTIARQRVVTEFGVSQMVELTERELLSLVSQTKKCAGSRP